MGRIALGVGYDGREWSGWQTQPGGRTVQDQLEAALSAFIDQPVSTICAGRTDAGVHALGQVVHVDSPVHRNEAAWVRGVNSFLPESIAVQWAHEVSDDFHARFSATSRSYTYVISNTPVRQPLLAGHTGWCFRPLDEDCMHQGAQLLLGEHDFSSFRSSQCQAASPIRTIDHASVERRAHLVLIHLRANAFLHHMVRNIVGELVLLGTGKTDLAHFKRTLEAKDRTQAAATFSAAGLYLTRVVYPDELLPRQPVLASPLFSCLESC
jgi:tRNA pseudouridine38-40 synthase